MTGVTTSTLSFYSDLIEDTVTYYSKRLFKALGLSHWHVQVQVLLTTLTFVIPTMLLVLLAALSVIFGVFNHWSVGRHESAIKKLRAEEHDLITQINSVKKN